MVPYYLDLRIEGQGAICSEDLFSPNASANEAPTVAEGEWEKLKLCPDSPDFIRWGLNGGENVTVMVEVDASDDAPDLMILDEDGQTILANADVDQNVAMASFTKQGAGDVLIKVGPISGASLIYSLEFGAVDPSGACQPDRFEPNNTQTDATAIPRDILTHLTMCDGDTDVFSLRLAAWESVSAYVLGGSILPHAVFVDSDGTVQAEGTPATYGEDILFVAKTEGTYFLSVGQADANVGWYDVGVEPE